MDYSTSIVIFLAAILVCVNAAWDYDTNGPSTWPTNYPNCGGSSQSPINIATDDVQIDSSLGLFYHDLFTGVPSAMTLKNNGHALQMDVTDGYTINNTTLLPFDAKLAQYHFHWADTKATLGSEHTINGAQYYGELHFVHYNTKYADLSTAASKSDGLAVLGFFVQADYPQDNKNIDQLLSNLAGLANKDSTFSVVNKFSVETLLPHDLARFYRYSGSLTTPTCDESVVWTVFADPIKISQAQAEVLSAALYATTDGTGSTVGNNFRPVQALNGRTVTAPQPLIQDSSASTAKPTFVVGLIASLLAGFF